jgi:hypothetical protein
MFISNPNINIQVLENIYKMVFESNDMYQIEVWGLNEAWQEIDKVHTWVCKKLMDIMNCAANRFAKIQLGSQ